ncbi:PadR family transcriptional regulator [Lentilactobacillus sp. IMAU92037]|uniref:PadR family transcriptional regulator n=1 Tax=Lentilactobacillus dabitei TaxID=2831523 RepID=UPI001C2C200E|nr:PadR family transcriptional regulator [Lentilactobacillus dabitei]MBV0930469.1 PadR family transcriptional regulator [Lentilactobacillus dabitei]
MYELLILGMLTSRDMSGYKLRGILESSLVPCREISNGVMYPLLQKLAAHDYIEFKVIEKNHRNKKLAHLTDLGAKRFTELMAEPVAQDAKRESIFRFKFRGMAGVDPATQLRIFNEYANSVQADLQAYQTVHDHLHTLMDSDPDNRDHLRWAIRSLNLSISICQAKQRWVEKCRQEINQNRGKTNEEAN